MWWVGYPVVDKLKGISIQLKHKILQLVFSELDSVFDDNWVHNKIQIAFY